MADITSGVAGLIISTGLIVLFGEVSADLPAAGQLVFSGSALLAHSVSQQTAMLPAYKRLSTLQNGHFLHTDAKSCRTMRHVVGIADCPAGRMYAPWAAHRRIIDTSREGVHVSAFDLSWPPGSCCRSIFAYPTAQASRLAYWPICSGENPRYAIISCIPRIVNVC